MTDTGRLLQELFDAGKIRLERGLIFDRRPKALGDRFDFSRIEGMLLGLAIGDALGNTTEGQLPSQRRREHGEIRDYLPNRYAAGKPVGLPSDDSQLAFWMLEQMLADGCFVPENVADCFCRRRIFGIGSTVRRFIGNRKSGKQWYECGPHSAGNGALMRIAPILIPHLANPSPNLWADIALSAMITHNDPGSTAACLAFANMLWQLLEMDAPPERSWWPETYVEVARGLEGDAKYRPRSENIDDYEGPISGFVEHHLINIVHRYDPSVLEACNAWYSGAYLLETVPSALYILMQHGHDPEEAIVRAVNDTKDNDTIAAIGSIRDYRGFGRFLAGGTYRCKIKNCTSRSWVSNRPGVSVK